MLFERAWRSLRTFFGAKAVALAPDPTLASTERIPPDTSAQPGPANMQAIVLIHGMGEQIPMDTIRGFVTTAWEGDEVITANKLPNPSKVWSKPDNRTGSLELRRITTRQCIATAAAPNGVRSDFYELYWADLTAGSTWEQFVSWVWYLLLRWNVPKDVRLAWMVLWVMTIIVAMLGCMGFIPEWLWTKHAPSWLPQTSMIALSAVAAVGLHNVATRSFGRVVRYTRAQPDNIASRASVRARGLALLRALHDHGSYERVIVVGHSLGTILAYDLVSYFWAEQVGARTIEEGTAEFDALRNVELGAARIEREQNAAGEPTAVAVSEYFSAQIQLRRAMAARPDDPGATGRWLISDLVTFGSPLSHAEFLLASGTENLRLRQASRKLPTSPPYREDLDPVVLEAARAAKLVNQGATGSDAKLLSFPEHIGNGHWILHHAAPFAAVRWTNVFDRSRLVVFGDVIGGPVGPSFGPAIRDVDLSMRDRKSWRFTHTRYWATNQHMARISAFREALNLLDADTPKPGVTFGEAMKLPMVSDA